MRIKKKRKSEEEKKRKKMRPANKKQHFHHVNVFAIIIIPNIGGHERHKKIVACGHITKEKEMMEFYFFF